jgi:hypothetical protein
VRGLHKNYEGPGNRAFSCPALGTATMNKHLAHLGYAVVAALFVELLIRLLAI